jgi:glutamate dehydrogenase
MLEAQGLLDRALEFLPAEGQIEERRAQQRGLTRPELAVILSYSKIELHASLVHTDIHEDPFLAAELEAYFPPQITQRFSALIREHRLRREIIAMLIGGSMINRMGPFFVLRAEEETGATVAQVARAYAIVRDVFGVRKLWREIEALDYSVEPKVQYDAIFEISRMVRRAVYWLLQNYAHQLDVEPVVTRFRPGVAAALAALPAMLDGRAGQHFAAELERLAASRLPDGTARQIAGLGFMTQMLDIIELAREFSRPIADVGRLYFVLGKELRLDVVREQIEALHVEGRWRAVARATLRENLAREQRALLRSVLRSQGHADGDGGAVWLRKNADAVARVQRALDEMQTGGPPDFATLSVALKEVSRLA